MFQGIQAHDAVRKAAFVSICDLVIANLGICFGVIRQLISEATWFQRWDVFSFTMVSSTNDMRPEDASAFEIMGLTILFIVFMTEIILFILLTDAIKKLKIDKLRLWYNIRFILFIMTVMMYVSQTGTSKESTLELTIWKGIGVICMILYKGYGLLVITRLEETIIHQEAPAIVSWIPNDTHVKIQGVL